LHQASRTCLAAPLQPVDSRALRSYHPTMPMWRCPHCATPQAEAARCWVCHRSSTACGACRHFRRAVAGQLGYCGLDRQRRPLRGDEIRPCWEAADAASINVPALPGIGPVWPLEIGDGRTTVRSRDFVEVESGPEAIAPSRSSVRAPGESRWSLWGDAET
jgi:hypothetical protein